MIFREKLYIKKIYPNTLEINLIEKEPIAIWQNKSVYHLITKNGDIIWKRIASSQEKINGPIYWPLTSINKKDSYRLSLRPEGSGMGSKLEIDFVFDKNIPLLKKDNIEKNLGKSKKDWISFIKKNIEKDNNTALTILLSERAPSSQRIKNSINEVIKTDNCK